MPWTLRLGRLWRHQANTLVQLEKYLSQALAGVKLDAIHVTH
jgi:hypothetical protein